MSSDVSQCAREVQSSKRFGDEREQGEESLALNRFELEGFRSFFGGRFAKIAYAVT